MSENEPETINEENLPPEILEEIKRIENERKRIFPKKEEKVTPLTEEELIIVKKFGNHFDVLPSDTKNFIAFCFSEVHENTSERNWETESIDNINSMVEAFKILCPGVEYSINSLDDKMKQVSFKWDPKNLFYRLVKSFH